MIRARTVPLAAQVAIGLTAVAFVAAVPLVVLYARAHVGLDLGEWVVGGFAPAFAVSGWWLVSRRPRLALGWLFLAAGLTVSGAALAAALSAAAYAEGWGWGIVVWGRWVFSWLWQPHSVMVGVALLLFPDGVLRSRLHRVLLWFIVGATVLSMLASAVRPGAITTTPNHSERVLPNALNPLGIDALRAHLWLLNIPLLLGAIAGLSPIVWTAVWWRRSVGERRRQFKWATLIQLSGIVAPLFVVLFPAGLGPSAVVAQTWIAQALIVVAILRWRAYDVEVVLRRSVLAVSLLTAGLGLYAVVVVVMSVSLGHTGAVPSAVGAAVAIFTFGPLSTVIRSGVNRLFYGRRDDPYLVVSELGRQLTRAADPAEGLEAVVAAITEQLRLPFAEVVDTDGVVLSRRHDPEPNDLPLELPLRHHGEDVGRLRVGHRRGSSAMTVAESELLESLSLQVGAAVAAVRLVRGLTAARNGLVLARQEERRRIQQDLHDGLSPQLYAVTLKLDAARNHIGGGATEPADELVGSARADVQRAIGDVRQLVYALGDPTVTSLGLRAAVEDGVAALTRPAGLGSIVELDELPALPAATEEAVYRIVIEAVTNVVRHARARQCVVKASLLVADGEDRLEVTVADDGRGIRTDDVPGVGRRSMHERVTQLGGTLRIDPRCGDDGPPGTVVTVTLPLSFAT